MAIYRIIRQNAEVASTLNIGLGLLYGPLIFLHASDVGAPNGRECISGCYKLQIHPYDVVDDI